MDEIDTIGKMHSKKMNSIPLNLWRFFPPSSWHERCGYSKPERSNFDPFRKRKGENLPSFKAKERKVHMIL